MGQTRCQLGGSHQERLRGMSWLVAPVRSFLGETSSLGENLARSHSRDRQGFGGFYCGAGDKGQDHSQWPHP